MGLLGQIRASLGRWMPGSAAAPAKVYLGLRDSLFALEPGDAGIQPTPAAPRVWGVLLEMGTVSGTATVVALADGTTSLYTSGGGGIIGGGGHERVAAAARRCVREADLALDAFPMVDSASLPGAGRSALVILAYEGRRRVEEDDATLGSGIGPVAVVYRAAQDVITELRQVPGAST